MDVPDNAISNHDARTGARTCRWICGKQHYIASSASLEAADSTSAVVRLRNGDGKGDDLGQDEQKEIGGGLQLTFRLARLRADGVRVVLAHLLDGDVVDHGVGVGGHAVGVAAAVSRHEADHLCKSLGARGELGDPVVGVGAADVFADGAVGKVLWEGQSDGCASTGLRAGWATHADTLLAALRAVAVEQRTDDLADGALGVGRAGLGGREALCDGGGVL